MHELKTFFVLGFPIRELKNHDDDFVDDDRKWVQCIAQARRVNFVVVVSSMTPNKVESRRPASFGR